MSKSDNVMIEVVCDGGVKRSMKPYVPEALGKGLNSHTGVVDFGPGHGGLWEGYAEMDNGVWKFHHYRRVTATNDNAPRAPKRK